MPAETVIRLGGLFNVAFAVFHVLFWRLFDWKRDLASLTFTNRQVMQILNLCLTFAFLMFAYVSFFHTAELLGTGLERALLLLIPVFWLLHAVVRALSNVAQVDTTTLNEVAYVRLTSDHDHWRIHDPRRNRCSPADCKLAR